MKTLALVAGIVSSIAFAPAWAVNKCTGADGKVTYQETACSTQAKDAQQVKTWVTEGYSGHRSSSSSARQEVTPNLKLAGPPGSEALLGLYRRWADAERLAFSTSRIALSGPIASMQALQREAEATIAPACLAPAQKTLTELIAKSTEAVLQFMGKQEVTAMAYQIVHRPKLIPAFETAVMQANCQ